MGEGEREAWFRKPTLFTFIPYEKSILVVRSEPIPFAVGDEVRLKKPHPCGGFDWTVVRLGADIGLKCQRCGRRVLLSRRELERRLKQGPRRAADLDHEAENEDPAAAVAVEGEVGA